MQISFFLFLSFLKEKMNKRTKKRNKVTPAPTKRKRKTTDEPSPEEKEEDSSSGLVLHEKFDDFSVTSNKELDATMNRTLIIKFDGLGMSMRMHVCPYFLASRSQYFRKLFSSMAEQNMQTIEIKSIPHNPSIEEKESEGLVNPYYSLAQA